MSSSNKNLKVYKILFVTQVKTLHLAVKFPCEIKMTWKRSNESAQTKKVKLVDGKVTFNETLKLNVNMYFDTIINKFVEKKCIYSFLIYTQKGQKSAGSVTFDLSEFFNKRIYDVQESFVLQKCPVKDTKVDMKISYDQSVQSGYDSRSQMSMSSQLDVSGAQPLDMSEMNQSMDKEGTQGSEHSSSTVDEKATRDSGTLNINSPQKKKLKNQSPKKRQSEKFSNLDESDVDTSSPKKSGSEFSQEKKTSSVLSRNSQKSLNEVTSSEFSSSTNQKIGDNIKGINEVSNKLNKFVNKFKDNIKYEMQEKDRKINKLTEELLEAKEKNATLQTQISSQIQKTSTLQKEYAQFKSSTQSKIQESSDKLQQAQRKLQQQLDKVGKLESRLLQANNKGEEEGNFIKQLKKQHAEEQQRLQTQVNKLKARITQMNLQKTELQTQNKNVQKHLSELSSRYESLVQKYQGLQNTLAKREGEIETTRINLDKAYENLYDSLGELMSK